MDFKIFELASHIGRYNQQHNKSIVLDESFGLQALDANVRGLFVSAANLVTQCHPLITTVESSSEKASVKKTLLIGGDESYYGNVKLELEKINANSQLSNSHRWYCDQQRHLLNAHVWQDFLNTPNDPTTREMVRSSWVEWGRHQQLSHYTSQALGFVAEHGLVTIESYYELAVKELSYWRKRRRLPGEILAAFQTYLGELKQSISSAKFQLCWAMLTRMQVASEREDLYYDDVTMSQVEKLISKNVVQCDSQFLRYPRRGLNHVLMAKFHQYINEHGTEKQKKTLGNLRWFSGSDELITVNDHVIYLVPKSIIDKNLLPGFSFFKFIFRRRWFRKEFYKKYFGLMLSLRMLPLVKQSDVKFNAAWVNQFFTGLSDVENDLMAADKESASWLAKGIWGWICRTTNTFIHIWHDFSLKKKYQIVQRKIDMISALRALLEYEMRKEKPVHHVISNQFANNLLHHLRALTTQVEKVKPDSIRMDRFSNDKQFMYQVLNGLLLSPQAAKGGAENPGGANIGAKMKQQSPDAGGKGMPSADVSTASSESGATFFRQSTLANKSIPQGAGNMSDQTTLQGLKHLDLMHVNDTVFSNAVTTLKQAANSIQQNHQNMDPILDVVNSLFYNYLQEAEQLKEKSDFDPLAQRFLAVETSLLQSFVPEPIRYRIQLMRNLRQTQGWVFLFAAQAKASLSAYSQGQVNKNNLRHNSHQTEGEMSCQF